MAEVKNVGGVREEEAERGKKRIFVERIKAKEKLPAMGFGLSGFGVGEARKCENSCLSVWLCSEKQFIRSQSKVLCCRNLLI